MAPHILCIRVDLRSKFHPFVLTLLYWGQKRVISFFIVAIYSEFFALSIYTLYYNLIKNCEVM